MDFLKSVLIFNSWFLLTRSSFGLCGVICLNSVWFAHFLRFVLVLFFRCLVCLLWFMIADFGEYDVVRM